MTLNKPQISDYMKKSVVSLSKCLRSSLELPVKGNSDDTIFHEFPQYKKVLNGLSLKILNNIQQLIDKEDGKGNLLDSAEKKGLDDKFNILVEVNDRLLDKCNNIINQIENPNAKPLSQMIVAEYSNSKSLLSSDRTKMTPKQTIKLLSGVQVERPQLKFSKLPDNSKIPFRPILTTKPNALVSLDKSLIVNNRDNIDYPHPYAFELDQFATPSHQLTVNNDPESPKPLSDTRYEYIESRDRLIELIDELRSEREIAVDLEHHSVRTYLGITCLMQISTRTADFVIDTLRLHDDLEMFNEVFTDPNILKVFHGSSSDLMWLQRDFGVYLVNLFDTGLACEMLSFPRKSLSYLLEKYCAVQANKEYQRLTDWRIRPLIPELIEYARTDTHYLLYIYDRLKLELAAKGETMLANSFQSSHKLCRRLYAKPVCDFDDCMELYRKSSENFNPRQLYALRRLWELRDNIARDEDESPSFVLPNRTLLAIAQVLPRETSGVLACCSQDWKLPLLRKYVYDFQKICLEAYNESLSNKEKSAPIKQNVLDFLLSKHDRTVTTDDFILPPHSSIVDNDDKIEPSLFKTRPTQNHFIGIEIVKSYLKCHPMELDYNHQRSGSIYDENPNESTTAVVEDNNEDKASTSSESDVVIIDTDSVPQSSSVNIDLTESRKRKSEETSSVTESRSRPPKEARVIPPSNAPFDYRSSIEHLKQINHSNNGNQQKQFQPFHTKKFKKNQKRNSNNNNNKKFL